jgi:uncharacterized membrane protein YqhA
MKEFFRKLGNPSTLLIILTFIFTPIFCIGAIVFAIIDKSSLILEIISYVLYALAALTLSYMVFIIVRYSSNIKKSVITKIKSNKLGKKLLEDYKYRTYFSTIMTSVINFAFVGLNIYFAIHTNSILWYISLASYYTILLLIKIINVIPLKKYDNTNKNSGLKQYTFSSIALILTPLTLLIPILQICFLNRAFIHDPIVAIGVAAFTFYKIIVAIISNVKSHKQPNLSIQAIKNVSLADALVSIFHCRQLFYTHTQQTCY